MNTLKRLLSIIGICVLCLTAQAQVVIGVTRTGQTGTAGENLEFVDQFGNIVAHPTLSPNGGVLDAMRPSVVTNLSVTEVTKTSAATGGTVVNPGASALTECGVCYGTSPNPTTQDSHIAATPDADGNFSVNLTGLQPNTTYYVRAYATNAIGTSYGTAATFTTRGDAIITITGNHDTKVYNADVQSVTGYTVSIPDGVNINENEISYSGNAIAQHRIAGTWPMQLNVANFSCSNTNYDVTFQVTDGYLTITPAPATITVNGISKEYGDDDPDDFDVTVTGLQGNDEQTFYYMVGRENGENVGTYDFRVIPGSNPDYSVTVNITGKFTITPAPATVTAVAATKEYGAADPTFTATVTGLKNDDPASVISYTLSRAAGEDVGTYAITPTGAATQGNYTVTYVPTDFTITKAQATVTAADKSKTYGASDPELTATVTGAVNNETLNYTLARVTGENAGTYAINVTLGDNPNYEVTTTAGTLTITKATATVTADNATKVYGAADPTFTATVTGVQSGDQLNYTLARVTGENAGTYAINVTLGDNPNYEVTTTAGTFTITKATATVTADNATKVYGAADPTFTATVTGVQSGDQLNYTLARVTGENAGTYAINVTLGDNPNYEVTTTAGTFTITKATATVTANNASKVYGAADPTFTATVTGVQSGDQLNYTLARATGENAGEYAITVTLGSNPNYEVTATNGTFTINKAAATVTANDASKVYGAADPTFTATVTGVQSGDQLNYTLARVTGENAGTYAINVTLGDNPNYEVTTTAGTFTITPAPATVTAVAATKEYGAADPTFTATVTGLKNNDDASVINYTLSRAAGEDAGTYAITPTGAATQGNYTVTYVPADFTITPAAATVTASAKEKVYGETDPTFTATISGLRNPNDASQITYSLSRVSGQDVGTYTITPTGEATQGNYTVAYQTGTLTITPAAATVKADDKTKVAGESDPQFTATVTGLKRNDQPSVLNYSLSRATGETVGTYAITPTGEATQGNYTVTYQTGTLTITEPACPTLGTTSYTPDPVTSSATTISLTTPVNDVTVGATVTNPQYTVQVGNTTSTVTGTYSNGTMTGTITITSAMRGSAITVTPSITTAGCSNPGTVTGQAVEICVQPVLPSFGTVTNTNGSGKANLFKRKGVYMYFNVNNFDASLIQEMGFYISTVLDSVNNHSCSPAPVVSGQVDIHDYQGGSSMFDSPEYITAYYTVVSMPNCGRTTYYQPYMVVNICGINDTIFGSIKSFYMWGPESATSSSTPGPTVSASPNPVASGTQVTLSAASYMKISSSTLVNILYPQAVGTHTIEWLINEYPGLVSSYGLTSNNWTYYWKDDSGNIVGTPSHNNGTITVTPNKTTTYTAFSEFTYQGETCSVSKSIEVTVTP